MTVAHRSCHRVRVGVEIEQGMKNVRGLRCSYRGLITFVKDRPGHDRRYAIDASKIERELGWKPQEPFESGIRKTVRWYLDNRQWWERVLDGSFQLARLGEKA